jgi:probable F420-dependent oxidoreductase
MEKTYRFGVQATRLGSRREFVALCHRIEELGFSTLFVPDHFDDQLAPLTALASAAAVTTVLKVGSLVFDNDYRHPLVLARELATLDVLSEGRLEIGLGAGWMQADYEQSGITYDPPRARIDRLGEALEIMTALFSEESVSFSGQYYELRGARCLPRPVTRPHPPFIVGGGGRRILSLAARHAQIIGVNTSLAAGVVGPDALAKAGAGFFDERISWIRASAGEQLAEIELQCLTGLVEIGRGKAELLGPVAAALQVSEAEVDASPLALLGTEDEVVASIEEAYRRFGFSYFVIHEPEIEAFAPIVARLGGRRCH